MSSPAITPDLTLYAALQRVVAAYPNRRALTFASQHLTYRELSERINSLARKLRGLGVGPGDKVAVVIPNSFDYVCAFFAPAALGAVVVPLNPLYREKEFRHILSDAEASVVIAVEGPSGSNVPGLLANLQPELPHLRHLLTPADALPGFACLADIHDDHAPLLAQPLAADSLCALVYTSGTSGVPKAVMQSHGSMIAAAAQSAGTFNQPVLQRAWYLLRLTSAYGTHFLRYGLGQLSAIAPAPMHALLGYSAMLYCLMYGFRAVIAERFHPAHVLELIEQEHINGLIASPTMVMALLNSADIGRRNLSSLLSVFISAAPCPPDLARQARQVFRCPVRIAFGATEVGGATLITSEFDSDKLQSETVGRVVPGVEAQVVDDERRPVPAGQIGELAMRLPSSMLGYYKAPELTTQALDGAGWYYTGDLATIDEKGYVRIVGRKKDLIIRGGQNVFPAEIEAHLLSKPGIGNVAVVGVPDPFAGEHVWAFVIPKDGTRLSPADVLGYCRGEVAPYKVPDQVRIVDCFPMTSTGKVQKFALRDMALQERQTSQA